MEEKGLEKEKSLGELIDYQYELREERLRLQKQVDSLKVQEKALEQTIIAQLTDSKLEGGKGFKATASVSKVIRPTYRVDWDEYLNTAVEYFVEGDDTLMYKQIPVRRWRELLDSGILVPGTEVEEIKKLSLNKFTR